MRDELKRNFYIKEVAAKYDVYESILYRELERWTGGQPRRDRPMPGPAPESPPRSSAPLQSPASPEKLKDGERVLLKALFENRDDVARFVFAHVEQEYLSTDLAKKLFRIALEAFEDTGQIEVNRIIGEVESTELRETLVDLVVERHELGQRMQRESEIVRADPMVIAKDAVRSLVIGLVKNVREQKRGELKRLPVGSPEALKIGSEIQELGLRLSRLQDEFSGSGPERSQSNDSPS
jgi:hypothetical protein